MLNSCKRLKQCIEDSTDRYLGEANLTPNRRRDKTMSNYVFVLDANKQPLEPCTPGMARSLLKAGKAAVFRQYPFTIILKKVVEPRSVKHLCQLKLDPGSKVLGIALLQENKLIWAAELTHRGQQIKDSLESRRSLRRGRRARKTRYRTHLGSWRKRYNQRKMPYSSSLTDKEWEIIEPLLPKKKRTKPPTWSKREILDGVLYQLKNGCNWCDLPKDFPVLPI